MNDRKRPVLSGLRDELGALAGDLSESLRLRLELAQVELAEDYRSGKRLAIVLLAALVALLTSLPLMAVSLADALDGLLHLSRACWLLAFALALILASTFSAALAWRHFRRNVVALQDTIEELREDLLWLHEWTAPDQHGSEGPSRVE